MVYNLLTNNKSKQRKDYVSQSNREKINLMNENRQADIKKTAEDKYNRWKSTYNGKDVVPTEFRSRYEREYVYNKPVSFLDVMAQSGKVITNPIGALIKTSEDLTGTNWSGKTGEVLGKNDVSEAIQRDRLRQLESRKAGHSKVVEYSKRLSEPATDAAIAVAGEGIGESAVRFIGNKISPYTTNLIKQFSEGIDKTPIKNFKSEIDWAKWNKEIPRNKKLMNEYINIEKNAKSNGTWMKNPDGTDFKGTPEQFVQQNSQNFKKSFQNILRDSNGNILVVKHGSPNNFTEFDKSKFSSTTDTGDKGVGTYVSPLNYAKEYGNNIYNLYVNARNPIKASSFIDNNIPINSRKGFADSKLKWFHRELSEKARLKGINNYLDNDIVIGDEFHPNINEKAFEMVVPFSNTMKSAKNNNGMFDMTNPNIYKSIIGLTGTGLGVNYSKKK